MARHSQATEARMTLVYTADSVQLSVSDNGGCGLRSAGGSRGWRRARDLGAVWVDRNAGTRRRARRLAGGDQP